MKCRYCSSKENVERRIDLDLRPYLCDECYEIAIDELMNEIDYQNTLNELRTWSLGISTQYTRNNYCY